MRISHATLAIVLATCAIAIAAPIDDALAAYRAYVSTIRAGDAAAVAKLMGAVPETSRAYLDASIRSAIAIEAVKTEMTKQMGPPPPPEEEAEGWNMGQLPDAMLDKATGLAEGDDVVGVVSKDPQGEVMATLGWMVREGGAWKVPPGLVLGLEPAAAFVEPSAEDRASGIALAEAIVKASDVVLGRLRDRAYKTPVDVQSALLEEMAKAGGGMGPPLR